MKKIKFVNDQEPNLSAETLNELQDYIEAGVIEEAEIATDEALNRKVVSYRNVLVDEQALIKECGGLKLKKLNKLVGKTEQETREGYNLLNTENLTDQTINGVTLTRNEDGSFTLNGTSTNSQGFNVTITNPETLTANTTYTLKTIVKGTASSTSGSLIAIREDESTNLGNTVNFSGTSKTYTPTADVNVNYLRIYIDTGVTFTNFTVYPLLYEGTEAKDWEQYGKAPTPNFPSEVKTVTGNVEVNISNENLFIPEFENIYVHNADLTLTDDEYAFVATSTDMYFGEIRSEGLNYQSRFGRLYNVKGKSKIHFLVTNELFSKNYITAYDKNKISLGYISISSHKGSYDIPENAEYIILRIGYSKATVGETYKTKIMLSFEEISEYKKHEGGNYPLTLGSLELCKIGDYADYFYKAGSKWFKRSNLYKEKITSSHQISIETYGVNSYKIITQKKLNTVDVDKVNIISNYFYGVSYNHRGLEREYKIYVLANYNCVIRDTQFTTIEELKTFLDSNEVYVIYKLAEPTDTEITDTTLIAQLNAIAEAQLYEGTTNITITGDNLTPIADIDYWTWFKGESGEPAEETKYKMKNDFAVITGNSEIEAETATNIEIAYPDGYTEENSVLISCGIKAGTIGYNYVGKHDDAMDLYYNAVKRTLTLSTDKIILRIDNKNTSKTTYNYKLVLMKI